MIYDDVIIVAYNGILVILALGLFLVPFIVGTKVVLYLEGQKTRLKKDISALSARGYEAISLTIELPDYLYVTDFREVIQNVMTALDKASYILYLIKSGDVPKRFFKQTSGMRKNQYIFEVGMNDIASDNGRALPMEARLVVVRFHYGSPAVFDIAGLGKFAKELREMIKDLLYRARLEKEKARIENAMLADRAEINRVEAHLRIEKMAMDVVKERIEIMKQIQGLNLSDGEKDAVMQGLARELVSLPLTNINRKSLSDTKQPQIIT
jgi:hypothetical protein